ncbi:MAG: SPOR domain-containing protein [Bacteroidales bacterium]|nr:SPOR domain-containing protein [Bacteroidales bacterium]
MKKFIIVALLLGVLTPACKNKQKLTQQQEEITVSQEPKVFTAPPTAPQPTYQAPRPTASTDNTKPVSARTENFDFAEQGDAGSYTGNYFIIVGSFSSIDNANRLKQELIPQGFSPVILRSESGLYRVCVNSYTDEASARRRVQQIRADYPKYADAWMLVKKK